MSFGIYICNELKISVTTILKIMLKNLKKHEYQNPERSDG